MLIGLKFLLPDLTTGMEIKENIMFALFTQVVYKFPVQELYTVLDTMLCILRPIRQWLHWQKSIFYLFLFFLNFILYFIQQFLISYPFYTYECIHVNTNRPIHPTTTSTPRRIPSLVSIHLFSTSVSLFLPCKPVHLYHFSIFHIYALIYDICFSLPDLLHSVWQTLGPSTSLQMTQFCSFLWLSNIPLYICTTSFLSICLSMGI